MDFYLGIDIGTSRVKAVLFDQHFTACASAAENTSPRLSANGYAEQDMTQLWHSVLAILRQIARHPALQAGRLRAIGLAGQGEGVWLSDAQGEPVGPGILWSDTRSHELMSDLLRRPGFDRRYFADTGTHLQPCNTSLQLYWLKQYQPARLAAARYLFFAKDWIRFRLTGVAALTGLPAATPVAAGALDVFSAALGCGAVNEGDIYTILGTTCCTGIVCRGPQTVNEATRFVTHTEAGQVISLFPMQAGTPNIDWLQQHISLDADLDRLEQAIAEVEPGSGGVFWQPYLNGERAPFYSPDARAGFFGIRPHTTRAELQRAVFEGLAFAIVDALQGYPQGGELYLTGGGAASATWLQIIADCTGRTVVSSAFNELSARGAAILAARSVAALAGTPPLAQTRYQPRPQAHARYAALYPVYRLLREQMLPVWQARQAALQSFSQDLQP
ncbi:FGGY-family carbohydrate kinase [Klebsiella sp. 10982]|uniref:FGGY-family carbohydrate kinase n=1 Tax=Klebsiella sp. 10982 TaxID=1196034 RepID=UPI000B41AF36|nr:carbohydrate kinase [Klebsiella sp. PO552]